jgi:class 3 adenylate cyclase
MRIKFFFLNINLFPQFLFLWVLGFFFMNAYSFGKGNNVFTLKSHLESFELLDFVEVLEDKDSKYSINDFLSGNIQSLFLPLKDNSTVTDKKSAWWGKVDFKNELNSPTKWLFHPGNGEFIEVFLVKENKVVQHHKCGYGFRNYDRSIPQIPFPLEVNITLPPDSEITIYVKLVLGNATRTFLRRKGNYSQPGYTYLFKPFIHAFENDIDNFYWNTGLKLFFVGGILMMAIYIISLFFTTGYKEYLYYFLFLFSSVLFLVQYYGIYVVPYFLNISGLRLDFYILVLGAFFIFFNYILFMKGFFKNEKVELNRSKIFNYVLLIIIGSFGVLIIYDLLIGDTGRSFTFLRFNVIFICIICVPVIYNAVAKSQTNRNLIFWGSIIFLASVIAYSLVLEFFPEIQNAIIIILFGLIGEMLCFSVGLGIKIRQEEKEKLKVQEILIEKLKEKQYLQNKVNEELEEKVKERASEIELQANEIARQKEVLEIEKHKSDQLLLNILPEPTAKELKEKGVSTPKYYDNVTVFVSDFQNFTQIAEKMTPVELLVELNTCFIAFDRIIKKYHLEKIKTIGDAYMCAGGIPLPDKNSHYNIVTAAIEIAEFIKSRGLEKEKLGEPFWNIRIGVHSGPLVTGVVGEDKFSYDIWGETVRLTFKLESNSHPGRINISSATYNLIKDKYLCTSNGILAYQSDVVEMYFVEGLIDTAVKV